MTNGKEEKDALKISWMGIDGLLCLCFVLVALVIGYAMINDVDIVLGKILPYTAMLVTFLIFIKYIGQVIAFTKKTTKKS